MFSYYGSKSKIIKNYPYPKYSLIIEPFAGASWYSVFHNDRKILLNEKYKVIFDIWNWLISDATPEFILGNCDFFYRQNIDDVIDNIHYKNLVGFCINRGSVSPCKIVQKWSCQSKLNFDWSSTTNFQLKKIAGSLKFIKSWKILFGDYKEIPNIEATWFIDPPYQFGGDRYVENKINYKELADWCKSRKGQVIVCENSKANWLDFKPLVKSNGQRNNSIECIYTNTPVTEPKQLNLI